MTDQSKAIDVVEDCNDGHDSCDDDCDTGLSLASLSSSPHLLQSNPWSRPSSSPSFAPPFPTPEASIATITVRRRMPLPLSTLLLRSLSTIS